MPRKHLKTPAGTSRRPKPKRGKGKLLPRPSTGIKVPIRNVWPT